MYYIINLNGFDCVGKACGQLSNWDNAFRFTSLLHAESVLAHWQANYPRAVLLEVNELTMTIEPVLASMKVALN